MMQRPSIAVFHTVYTSSNLVGATKGVSIVKVCSSFGYTCIMNLYEKTMYGKA